MTDGRWEWRGLLRLGAAAVVVWRVLAVYWPHAAGSDPQVVKVAMVPLGLSFLACGLWAFERSPGIPTLLFALYCLTAGLHWGGPLGIGPPVLQTFELVLYVVVSVVLGPTLLLHLALVFPSRLVPVTRPAALALLYLPAVLGVLPMAAALLAPGASRSAMESGVPALMLVGTLYGVSAFLVWLGRLVLRAEDRRRGRLTLLVAAFLLGAVPHMLVSAIGPLSELDGLFNLSEVFAPLALAFVLTRDRGGAGFPAGRQESGIS